MSTIFGIPTQLLSAQLLLGLINGAFYALLSLGLAVIFGMLGIVNFAHGALYMLGAFTAWMLLEYAGIGYWPALALAPLLVGTYGLVLERTLIRRLYTIDHVYGLLLTYGIALVMQGAFRNLYGSSGLPYTIPSQLQGALDLGFMFLPVYRAWVVVVACVVCAGIWYLIDRTSLGAKLTAAMENAPLLQALGVDVPRMISMTYAGGAALAAFAGVLAAPIYSVNPNMGENLMITVFAIVVIGGMGSMAGSIVAGISLGLLEGIAKIFYPQGSVTVIFLVMAAVLLTRPAGIGGAPAEKTYRQTVVAGVVSALNRWRALVATVRRGIGFLPSERVAFLIMLALIAVLPFFVYPIFLMKVMCFALFACSLNLLAGYIGLMSFGHAAFFGIGSYIAAYTAKTWGLTPELAIILGGIVAMALGVVFGWLSIQRPGLLFAMITLALAQMVYFFCLQADFTGGEDGIQRVPRGRLFGVVSLENNLVLYVVVATIFVAGFLIIHRTIHSPFGQVLKSIRDNEARTTSLGYRTIDHKLIAFVLASFLAGIAGATKAIVFGLATLTDVSFTASGEAVLMTIVGGLGTLFGPVLGALVLTTIEAYLAKAGAWVSIAHGAVFVVSVLVFRAGIVGEIAKRWKVSL